MVWLLGLLGAVAVAAVVLLVVTRRRLDAAQRTVRDVQRAVGSPPPNEPLGEVVRTAQYDLHTARARVARLAAALDGTAIGVALMSGSGVVEYANPAARAALEGSGERTVLRTRAAGLVKRVSSLGVSETLEITLHHPDRRVLGVTAVPFSGPESDGTVCVYIEDLSAQRRVEAMRTDFVANASHELKTPLGALALLAETLGDAKDEETRARLTARIRTEATRMASVLDDVLQLAETESLGVEYVPVHMVEVIEEAVEPLEEIAIRSDIELERGTLADVEVLADRQQLVSAVRNLIRNAITYTAAKNEPGTVIYRTRSDDDFVRIEIEDTGIGIPSRYTDRVFERFFRVDRARSRESGGTGLGLSIVRTVAVAHGGTVDVSSRVGVGSTFTIRLPTIAEE